MSDRDRTARDRGSEIENSRSSGTGERAQDPNVRRRDCEEFDVESFELPAWDAEYSKSSSRQSVERSGRDDVRKSERDSSIRPPSKDPLPTLGDAFQQTPQRATDAPSRTTAPRNRTGAQPSGRTPSPMPRSVDLDDEVDHGAQYSGVYSEDDGYGASYRQRRSRRRGESNRLSSAPARPPMTRQVGGMLAAAGPQTRLIAIVGGIVLVSLVLMAATLLGRLSSLPEWIPIHLNAEGEPDRWGTNETLWRIPLMAFVFTIMCGGVAWYLRSRDAFGARFLVMSAILIHVTSWIAVVNFVW